MKVWISALLLLLSVSIECLAAQLPNAPSAPVAPSRREYTGDETCRSCHQKSFDADASSAHTLASRSPDANSIDGNFGAGENILRTANPYLYFEMNATRDGFFQKAIARFPPVETISHQERFDVVIGSGRKGQTYLYWKGDELFELPVSYWTETHRWINSPGYPDGLPNFDKPIIARCLECHASYITPLPPPLNRFDRSSLVLGITCERCHGPGRAHAQAERSPTKAASAAHSIVNPASLSRDRQMDVCASCHAGPGTPKAPPFSFVPGGVLADVLTLPPDPDDTQVDVHAHQVQLLKSSRCYQSSQMTCATCHNVHKPQRNLAEFSDRCLTCHRVESCGRFQTVGTQIEHKCVDCHMPLKQSSLIVFDAGGRSIKPQVRSHRIAIY